MRTRVDRPWKLSRALASATDWAVNSDMSDGRQGEAAQTHSAQAHFVRHFVFYNAIYCKKITKTRPKKHLKMNKEVSKLLPRKDLIQVK